jgi:hypothetical protein
MPIVLAVAAIIAYYCGIMWLFWAIVGLIGVSIIALVFVALQAEGRI